MNINKPLIKLICSCVIIIISNNSFALTEVSLFHRCYKDLTNKRPDKNNPYLKAVENGSGAIDECMKVLNLAMFVGDKIPSANNPIAISVVKQFHKVHRSWFTTESFSLGTYGGAGTSNSHDPQEGPLYYANTLFKTSVPFSSIVTRTKSLRAIRYTSNLQKNGANRKYAAGRPRYGQEFAGFQYSEDKDTHKKLNLDPLEMGKLIGIKDRSDFIVPMSWGGGRYDFREDSGRLKDEKEYIQDLNLFNHLGSGIIGSSSYIFQNDNGFEFLKRKNGGLRTARRWTRNVMSDLFCRNLPVVREKDAVAYIKTDSELPFRGGRTCMQCHTTLDPLAKTLRNVRRIITSPKTARGDFAKNVRITSVLHKFDGNHGMELYETDLQNEDWPEPGSDPKWHRRPPTGRLYFRDYQGDLINQKVDNLEDAGNYFATMDDLYLCAAKRYYEYFTGVIVNISDLELNPILDSPYKIKELQYRSYIIKLGLELKADPKQDLKTMIEKILRSSGYKYPGKGVE